MKYKQATEAGNHADEIIKQLSQPKQEEQIEKEEVVENKPKPKIEQNDWEGRFKTFKTSTDRTIHELRKRVNHFELVEEENERLKQQLAQRAEEPVVIDEELRKLFSEEELDGVSKFIQAQTKETNQKVSNLEARLKKAAEDKIAEDKKQTQRYIVDVVSKAVPNYNEIDVDPRFREFMNDLDTFGNSRMDLLIRAKEATPPDINRIIQFYQEFAALFPIKNKQEPKQTQQELLQTPRSRGGGILPTNSPVAHWTNADIQAFYKDKALGVIPPKEAAKLEQALFERNRHR